MKTTLTFCACLFIFLFSNCKKSNSYINISTAIIGKWELRNVNGGYRAPNSPTNFARGNGNIIQFTNQEYKIYKGEEIIQSGSYSIRNDSTSREDNCWSVSSKEHLYRLIYNNTNFYEVIYISNNKLFMMNGCVAADGIETIYEKIK